MTVKIESADESNTDGTPQPLSGWDQMQHNAFRPEITTPTGINTYPTTAAEMQQMGSINMSIEAAKHDAGDMHHDMIQQEQPHRMLRESISEQQMGQRLRHSVSSNAKDPVPLPPQASSTAASGPMSSDVTIPPRPRPGRKPLAQEMAADRRRLQNRIAQRNFRDKRQQKLVETQCELEEKKQEYQDRINELERQLQEMRKSKRSAEEECGRFRKRFHEADKRAKSAESKLKELSSCLPVEVYEMTGYARKNGSVEGHYNPTGLSLLTPHSGVPTTAWNGAPLMTPPEDHNSHEVDFTYWSRNNSSATNSTTHRPRSSITSNPSSHLQSSATSSDSMASHMDFTTMNLNELEGNCGFCTDDQNCACKGGEKQRSTIAPATNTTTSATMEPLQAMDAHQTIASLPGSCDACQHDPARAQACRDLATRTSIQAANDVAAMPPPPSVIPCSTIVESFTTQQQGSSTKSIAEMVAGGRRMPAWPRRNGGEGYEIEEQEAAAVLQALAGSPSFSGEASITMGHQT